MKFATRVHTLAFVWGVLIPSLDLFNRKRQGFDVLM